MRCVDYWPTEFVDIRRVPVVGETMTPQREKDLERTQALRDVPRLSLEPSEENLKQYFRLIREEVYGKAAVDAANISDGQVEQIANPVSTSIVPEEYK